MWIGATHTLSNCRSHTYVGQVAIHQIVGALVANAKSATELVSFICLIFGLLLLVLGFSS